MDDIVSCCGRDCGECINFPHDCTGCNEVQGRVFWLEFVDEVICPIYNCCFNKMERYECVECVNYPCVKYNEEGRISEPVGGELLVIETVQPKRIDIKVS